MKRIIQTLALLATIQLQAQDIYVNRNDGSFQQISNPKEITFNTQQQVVAIATEDGTKSHFVCEEVDSISLYDNEGEELTYNKNKKVSFSSSDASSYNEIVEKIVTDELDDEYGDFVENFTTTKMVQITFTNNGVTCNSDVNDITYTINGNHIVINSTRSKAGYIVMGSCSNGSLKIYSEKKFKLMLTNLTLTNPTGPAINIQSGKSVYLTIAGTNTLCDGETYAAAPETEDQKGTIFSEGQLLFDGTGTLNVTAKGGHAICSDDYIRIRSGNINILSSVKDGFHTNDIFRVGRTAKYSPTININANSDGIDCGKGEVIIEAGKININSGGEAINVSYEEADPDPAIIPNFTIKGGFIKATTTGEKAAIVKATGDFIQNGGIIQGEVQGGGSKIVNCDGNITFTTGKLTGISLGDLSSDQTTSGGFKSDGDLTINGGTISIDCRGKGAKGFNCNGNLVISGGTITLLATNENFTSDIDERKTRAITAYDFTINRGNIFTKAYDHAINATTININNGNIQAFSSNTTAIAGETIQTGGWLVTQDAE